MSGGPPSPCPPSPMRAVRLSRPLLIQGQRGDRPAAQPGTRGGRGLPGEPEEGADARALAGEGRGAEGGPGAGRGPWEAWALRAACPARGVRPGAAAAPERGGTRGLMFLLQTKENDELTRICDDLISKMEKI